MYYLRKEPEERVVPEIVKTDDTVIPERKFMSDDRAIYKHHDFSRFYRGTFKGIAEKYQGMKVYQCKTLKRIVELRESMYQYCGEYFDIYDESGKVAI
ncbi:hypothetical protein MKY95_18865 [Paenibacillus sp. FSL P4-0176]|uniref:hypothetical protein n=1 Tax=Paenibacillus sp. FSL P4-0176 TaxID=2921631 RepID=UPI0030D27E3A